MEPLLHLTVGPLLLIIGLLVRRFPPEGINPVYGYRTRRSKASQPAWDFANRAAEKWIIGIGLVTSLIQLIGHVAFGFTPGILLGSGALLIGIVVMMIHIETGLRHIEEHDVAPPA